MVEDDFEEYHDVHLKKGREGKAKGFAAWKVYGEFAFNFQDHISLHKVNVNHLI